MRLWWNRKTRQTKDLVLRRAGSSPVRRTILRPYREIRNYLKLFQKKIGFLFYTDIFEDELSCVKK